MADSASRGNLVAEVARPGSTRPYAAQDSFAGAAGELTTDEYGQGWEQLVGTVARDGSGAASGTVDVADFAAAAVETNAANVVLEFTYGVVAASDPSNAGAVFRVVDDENFWLFGATAAGKASIRSRVAGVDSSADEWAETLADGDTVRLEVYGSYVRLWINGTAATGGSPYNVRFVGTVHAAGTKHGVAVANAGRISAWKVWDYQPALSDDFPGATLDPEWTSLGGGPPGVTAGQFYTPSGTDAYVIRECGGSDGIVEFEIPVVPGGGVKGGYHCFLRATDADNYIRFSVFHNGNVSLAKRVAAAETSLAAGDDTAHPVVAGDRVRVLLDGPRIWATVISSAGLAVLSLYASDSFQQAAGVHGLGFYNSGAIRLDSFRFYDLDAIPEVAVDNTLRWARGAHVETGGVEYVDRIEGVGALERLYFDADTWSGEKTSLTIDNLPAFEGDPLYMQAVHGEASIEDLPLRIGWYDAGTDAVDWFWWGVCGQPSFSPDGSTCTIEGTFWWDALGLTVPTFPLATPCHYQFDDGVLCPFSTEGALNTVDYPSADASSCDYGWDTPNGCLAHGMERYFGAFRYTAHALNDDDEDNRLRRRAVRRSVAPVVMGGSGIRTKPTIYMCYVDGDELIIGAVVSTVHPGFPASVGDVIKAKLFGTTREAQVDVWPGDSPQEVPTNASRYPDRAGHSNVWYVSVRFRLSAEEIEKWANPGERIGKHGLELKLAAGSPIARTGLSTENPLLQLEELFRRPIGGLGFAASEIHGDLTTGPDHATWIGARFTSRFELNKPTEFRDFLDRFNLTFATYVGVRADGKVYLGAKRDDETPAITFGGATGRPVEGFEVVPSQQSFRELPNQLPFSWRTKSRREREAEYNDKTAQLRAGGSKRKAIGEGVKLFGVYAQDEAAICAAVRLRELQNLNLTVAFRTPFDEGLDVYPGDVVEIESDRIINNPGDNTWFRVTKMALDLAAMEWAVEARVYDPVVYAYSADPLGVDILRDDAQPSVYARPPDVIPGTPEIVDIYRVAGDEDDDGREVAIRCPITWPTIDAGELTEQAEDGLDVPYPLAACEVWTRYTDEPLTGLTRRGRIAYPELETFVQLPYHKKRTVEFWYRPIGLRGDGPTLEYVKDPLKLSVLDEDVTSTEDAWDVEDNTALGAVAGDYLKVEREVVRVAPGGVAGDTLTLVASGGNRTPQMGTTSVAHPEGTEVGVAVPSCPVEVLVLNTPRYDMPTLANVKQKARRGEVRVKWADPDVDVLESVLVYWTLDDTLAADADGLGSDVADPSSFLPAWYVANPLDPPAGIQIERNRAGTRKAFISDDEIEDAGGTVGDLVYLRAAIKHRANFSEELSGMPAPTSYRDDLVTDTDIDGPIGAPHGGTGIDEPYDPGDILVAVDADTLERRTVGSDGDVLTVTGGVPVWEPPAPASLALDDLTDVAVPTPADYDVLMWKSTGGGAWINAALDATDIQTGTLPIARGGTGQVTAQAAFDALDPLTTKGDLVVHDGTNSVRHPVGTDDFVLAADSTATRGVSYQHRVRARERGLREVLKDPGATTLSVSLHAAPTETAASVSSNDDASGHYKRFRTSATIGNVASIASAYTITQRAHLAELVMRLRTDTDIGDVRLWLGLFSGDPSASATPAVHLAAFRYDTAADGTAFWRCVTDNGSGTPTVTTTSVAIAVSSPYTLRVQCLASSVRFWVNDTLAATHTATLPTSTQTLGYFLGVTALAAAIKSWRFGRLHLLSL